MLNIHDIKAFLLNDDGATAIEYGLIAALIAVSLISVATALGNQLNNNLDGLAGDIVEADAGARANTAQNSVD